MAAKEEEKGGGSLLLGLEAVLGHLEVGGGLLLNLVGQGVDLCGDQADSCCSIECYAARCRLYMLVNFLSSQVLILNYFSSADPNLHFI
jgi:hypothetical protein